MRRPLISVTLLLFVFAALGQQKVIDSLQRVLQNQKEDTARVNTLNELSRTWHRNNEYKRALEYADEALRLAKKLGFEKGKGDAYNRIGYAYYYLVKPLKALANYDTALAVMKAIGDKNGIVRTYAQMGDVYLMQDNHTEALKYLYTALRLAEETGQKSLIAACLLSIGATYSFLDYPAEALKNLTRAVKLYREVGDTLSVASCTQQIGYAYYLQNNLTAALAHYRNSLKLSEEAGIATKDLYARYNTDIGVVYEKQGQLAAVAGDKKTADEKYGLALKGYNASLYLHGELGDSANVAVAYNNLGNVYTYFKALPTAKKYLQRGFQLMDSLQMTNYFMYIYQSLAHLDSLEGNYRQAYFNYKKHIAYRDSSVNVKKMQESLLTTMQFEREKTEALAKAEQAKKEAEQLRIRNRQYFFMALLGLALLAGLVIAYLQWRYNRQKQKANTLLQEQKGQVEKAYTELKATQEQLIQKEKMASLGELTAGIAHEIQNPLNFVNNFSGVNKELIAELKQEMDSGNLAEAKAIADDIEQNEEKIFHHGKRAGSIVKGMLEHSRPSTGEKQSTDINALVAEYLQLTYHGLRAKDKSFQATLQTNIDPAVGKVAVVPQDIGRVLVNLFSNAFYAVNKKKELLNGSYEPEVCVSTEKANSKVAIKIRDNGTGIEQKVLDKIFQPFFTTKPTGDGVGLGLSLSYDIVTKGHGGELKVDTKEGEFTEFMVLLPT